jgi:hypothetical protein
MTYHTNEFESGETPGAGRQAEHSDNCWLPPALASWPRAVHGL